MKQAYSIIAAIIIILLLKQMQCSKDSDRWINRVDGMQYVRIPAGELQAQFKAPEGDDSMAAVTIHDDFLMAATEVTVDQFARFVKETGHITSAELDGNRFTWKSPGFEQTGNHPVVFLSHEDVHAYAEWAHVEIPTEVEWLYACRAGTRTKFFWGDSINDNYLWHRGNTGGTGTRPVGTKDANPWGFYNMVGNVREYVDVCDVRYNLRGSSWTRCPSYRTRQGFIANNMIAESVEAQLTTCAEPKYAPYPYDDDRGFRCIKRIEKED